jgi:hypothetical protein
MSNISSGRRGLIIILLLLFLSTFVSAAPAISFISHTPANNTNTANSSALINVSVSATNLSSFIFNWNGTSYTIFDPTLVLALNFNNNSRIGENSTKIVDASLYGRNGTTNGGVSGTADSRSNSTQCNETNSYWLFAQSDYCNGWYFEATSGAASGSRVTISDYTVYATNNKLIRFSTPLTGFTSTDNYTIYYDDKTGPTWTTSGRFGGGILFDGKDDSVRVDLPTSVFADKFSIEAWIKTRSTDTQSIACKNGPISFSTNWNSNLYLGIYNGSAWAFGAGLTSIAPNTWYHVAGTYDGSNIRLYVNSVLENVTPQSGNMGGNGGFEIGADNAGGYNYGTGDYFNGTIDELRIYNRTLSASEILMHYQYEFTRHNSTEYWFADNLTNLVRGQYSYYAWANDTGAHTNQTGIRYLNIIGNTLALYVVPAITDVRILPNSSISDSYLSDSITLRASPGEFTPASFVAKPTNGSLRSVIVEASNLTGSRGTINSGNIDIKVVKCWYQAGIEIADPYLHPGLKVFTPELLLNDDSLVRIVGEDNYLKLTNGSYVLISDPSGVPGIPASPTVSQMPVKDSDILLPVNISDYENKQFWITVKVPNNASAGNYSGTITLRNSSQTLGELNINLEVLPINLSRPYLTYSIYYAQRYNVVPTLQYNRNESELRAELSDMFNHGVTNPSVYGITSTLGTMLNLRNEVGMDNDTLYYAGIWLSTYTGNLPGLRSKLNETKNIMSSYGYSNLYVYHTDERYLNDSVNRSLMTEAHNAGAKVFVAQGAGYAEAIADILDLVNVAYEPNITLAATYHFYNHKIFCYGNPQSGIEQPERYRRNYGLLLWQNNYDGAMDFAYHYNFNNTWNDFDGAVYRDHNFVYPTSDGVIDTIQWEGFREAVNDIKYLTTLNETITAAKDRGVDTSVAEAFMDDLRDSDLNLLVLDDVRSQMIEYILSLQEEMEGSCELPGDNEPCGTVTLGEVVNYINAWIRHEATLADIIRLINAWVAS